MTKRRQTYPLLVDYGRSAKKGIKAGRYNSVNFDIAFPKFPTSRKGTAEVEMERVFDIALKFPTSQEGTAEVEMELIHLNRYISIDKALCKLYDMGYRPAEFCELLAFGEQYPEVQRHFWILALGSVYRDQDGYRSVPLLFGNKFERYLYLDDAEDHWDGYFRFAAVRYPDDVEGH